VTPGSAVAERPALNAEARLENYSGVERAAILLLTLGDQASPLMEALDDDELREISSVMSGLGAVPPHIVEQVVAEFMSRLSQAGFVLGSFEQTERMLLGIFPPDRVTTIMEELRGPAGRNVWDKLSHVNEKLLAGYLVNEYPQTVAVVLSRLPATSASKILAELPHDFAVEVINRMLTLDTVSRDVLQGVENTLRGEFINSLTRTTRRDSHEAMAEIFNHLDRSSEAKFFARLDERQQTSAEKIRALMFVFEDLNKLDPAGVQTLLRQCDKADLALALKSASEPLRALFFSNMSERGAKLLREDMQAMGPVRARDVDAAQMRLVTLTKELAARGELMLASSNAEDELIY